MICLFVFVVMRDAGHSRRYQVCCWYTGILLVVLGRPPAFAWLCVHQMAKKTSGEGTVLSLKILIVIDFTISHDRFCQLTRFNLIN